MTQAEGTNPQRARQPSASRGDVPGEYRRRKLDLAELIRAAMSLAEERRDSERVASARELLARLAEDRFQLAVVGQFSRGKSTLINAILGRSTSGAAAVVEDMAAPFTSRRTGQEPSAQGQAREPHPMQLIPAYCTAPPGTGCRGQPGLRGLATKAEAATGATIRAGRMSVGDEARLNATAADGFYGLLDRWKLMSRCDRLDLDTPPSADAVPGWFAAVRRHVAFRG
jgi:hypothetical protein